MPRRWCESRYFPRVYRNMQKSRHRCGRLFVKLAQLGWAYSMMIWLLKTSTQASRLGWSTTYVDIAMLVPFDWADA